MVPKTKQKQVAKKTSFFSIRTEMTNNAPIFFSRFDLSRSVAPFSRFSFTPVGDHHMIETPIRYPTPAYEQQQYRYRYRYHVYGKFDISIRRNFQCDTPTYTSPQHTAVSIPPVGVFDEEHGRLEHTRNAAAAHRRAPHHHVGRREIVQQPRRVRPVLGGYGDVHDAPRPVEGLQ